MIIDSFECNIKDTYFNISIYSAQINTLETYFAEYYRKDLDEKYIYKDKYNQPMYFLRKEDLKENLIFFLKSVA